MCVRMRCIGKYEIIQYQEALIQLGTLNAIQLGLLNEVQYFCDFSPFQKFLKYEEHYLFAALLIHRILPTVFMFTSAPKEIIKTMQISLTLNSMHFAPIFPRYSTVWATVCTPRDGRVPAAHCDESVLFCLACFRPRALCPRAFCFAFCFVLSERVCAAWGEDYVPDCLSCLRCSETRESVCAVWQFWCYNTCSGITQWCVIPVFSAHFRACHEIVSDYCRTVLGKTLVSPMSS